MPLNAQISFLPITDLKDYDSSTENLIIFNKNICTRCFQKDVNKRARPSLNLCTFLCKNLMYYNIEGFIYAIKELVMRNYKTLLHSSCFALTCIKRKTFKVFLKGYFLLLLHFHNATFCEVTSVLADFGCGVCVCVFFNTVE